MLLGDLFRDFSLGLIHFYHDHLYLFSNYALVFLIIFFVWVNKSDFRKLLKKIPGYSWKILGILFILALLLRIFFSPFEQTSMDSAEWEYKIRAGCLVPNSEDYKSRFDECNNVQDGPHQIGFAVILGFFYTFFGISSMNLYILNVILGSLSVLLIFVLTYLMSRNEKAALFSALILSAHTLFIYYNGTGEAETFFIFMLIFSMICFFNAIINDKWKNYLLLFFVTSLAGSIRREGLLFLLPIFVIGVFLYKPKKWKIILTKFLYLSPIIVFFGIPLLHFTAYFSWGVYGQNVPEYIFSFYNILLNSGSFGEHIAFFMGVFSFFSIIIFLGFFSTKKLLKEKLFLIAWFLLINIFYMTFWGYKNGLDGYFVNSSFILAIFVSIGFYQFLTLFEALFKKLKKPEMSKFVWIFIMLFAVVTISNIHARMDEGNNNYIVGRFHGEIDNIKKLSDELSPDSYILAAPVMYNALRFETSKEILIQDVDGLQNQQGEVLSDKQIENAISDKGIYAFEIWPFEDYNLCDPPGLPKYHCLDFQVIVDRFNMTLLKKEKGTWIYSVNGLN